MNNTTQNQNQNAERIKQITTASMRKNLSIAFFNATNNAIEIVKANKVATKAKQDITTDSIVEWRDWLLEEYQRFYSERIEPINSDSITTAKAITTIASITNIDVLRRWYAELPEDIANDTNVLAYAKEHATRLKMALQAMQLPDIDISVDVAEEEKDDAEHIKLYDKQYGKDNPVTKSMEKLIKETRKTLKNK